MDVLWLTTMSIYENGRRKIYPDWNPVALQEPQAYCFKKSTESEAYLLDEMKVCENLVKKMKKFNTIKIIEDTSLITFTVFTRGVKSTSSVALPVGIALSGTSLPVSLA